MPEAETNQTVSIDAAEESELLFDFDPEEPAEEFFDRASGETTSGVFVAVSVAITAVSPEPVDSWGDDLSPAPISGDGIDDNDIDPDDDDEEGFLRVGGSGRQSKRRAVVPTGTRLCINPAVCTMWAEDLLQNAAYSLGDIDTLLEFCEGNEDEDELRANLIRNLEAAGFELLEDTAERYPERWEALSAVSSEDLAEGIEAVLTRDTKLPGTQRFRMEKSRAQALLAPMTSNRQELLLSLLCCESATVFLLEAVESVRDGSKDPRLVSLRSIFPKRPEDTETAEFFAAAVALKLWSTRGRVMDGKGRREALASLEALDCTLDFYKEIVTALFSCDESKDDARRLEERIAALDAATEQLIVEHLPYARRVAARDVEEGEDPEDVFQVACTGLLRAPKRFDPERGIRFVDYSTFWMKQALSKWRADEASAIRIPVNRYDGLAKLSKEMELRDIKADDPASDQDIADELGVSADEVRQFRTVPRFPEHPSTEDQWDELLAEPDNMSSLDSEETSSIVADCLAELKKREAEIIRYRFGLGDYEEMTLEDIAQIYGVSRERVRQIVAKALEKLSAPSHRRRLQELLGM